MKRARYTKEQRRRRERELAEAKVAADLEWKSLVSLYRREVSVVRDACCAQSERALALCRECEVPLPESVHAHRPA